MQMKACAFRVLSIHLLVLCHPLDERIGHLEASHKPLAPAIGQTGHVRARADAVEDMVVEVESGSAGI